MVGGKDFPAFKINLLFLEGRLIMTIQYTLYQNKLTQSDNLYSAKVLKTASADTEDIIDRIVQQGSTLTRPDILAAIQSIFSAVSQMLLEGKRINFAGLCDFSCKIKGKFEGLDDRFDPARHIVDLCVTPAKKMQNYVRENAHTSKQATRLRTPSVFEYSDLASNTTNSFVTSGNIGSITGRNLSFNQQSEDEGIFFVSTGDNHKTKVQSVETNKPSRLIFMVPDLPEGSYYLQVSTRYTPAGDLRSGRLNCLLATEPELAVV
jgi:hypothetical protein